MTELSDSHLLCEYVTRDSEQAFETLVRRHVTLVYSTAFRHVGNAEDAKEVTQAVFIILARKAASIREQTVLSGWLYKTARLTSASFLRGEMRRRRREQEAYMQSDQNESHSEPAWDKLVSFLDDGVAELSEKERLALVLRFFEGRTFPEISAALGVKQSAVQKRVDRALVKLRTAFLRRGITVSAATLVTAIGANASQPTSEALTASILKAAGIKGTAASASTLHLADETLRHIGWTKFKTVTSAGAALLTIGAAALVLLNWTGLPSLRSGVGNELFDIRSVGVHHGTPWILIRSNAFTAQLGWQGGPERTNSAGSVLPLVWLVGQAYGISPARMVLPENWSKTESAFSVTPLSNPHKKTLQKKIELQFGLLARREMRETDVYELKHLGPAGLQATDGGAPGIDLFLEPGRFSATNQPLSTLADILECYLGCPVLDKTGLTNRYDFCVKWKARAREELKPALTGALREQLGCELTPVRTKLELLVVTNKD